MIMVKDPQAALKKMKMVMSKKKIIKKNQFLFDENIRPIKKVNRLCTVIAQ